MRLAWPCRNRSFRLLARPPIAVLNPPAVGCARKGSLSAQGRTGGGPELIHSWFSFHSSYQAI